MSKKKKDRIKIDLPQGGLNSAFSTLLSGVDTSHLPQGEELSVEVKTPSEPVGRIVLRRETAHRAGKTVIVVSQFADHISTEQIGTWGRQLKKVCGCGGTVVDREIEIQGEKIPMIRRFFENEGFRVDGERERK